MEGNRRRWTVASQETWVTTDDLGQQGKLIVDYDANGVTEVSREAMHWLLGLAGLRLHLDADES
jgi:hypothetical protein